MTELSKFPSTPHLFWLAKEPPRGDKLLSEEEASAFFEADLVVEEKVDGANLGISLSLSGELLAQNRGQYLGRGAHPQFEPLWAWLEMRQSALTAALGDILVIFGEWCFAAHSVPYDSLPDWFLGFDVFDRAERVFWATGRRNELFTRLGLAVVPELARGRFDREGLLGLLGPSRLGSSPMEGLYIRREDRRLLLARAKVVRPEFIDAMNEHWTRQPGRKNRLLGSSTAHRAPPRKPG
jgi:hypothetical protein